MKNHMHFFGWVALFSIVFFYACGTSQKTVEKEKLAVDIRKAVEIPDFTFKATHAYPPGYKSIYLSPYYDLKVSADTVKVYLPYYGRAYRAPLTPSEGGYRFTSTDFEYGVRKGKKKGNWDLLLTLRDLDRPLVFRLDLWENGTARLDISDADRQSISFQGDVVVKREEQ